MTRWIFDLLRLSAFTPDQVLDAQLGWLTALPEEPSGER